MRVATNEPGTTLVGLQLGELFAYPEPNEDGPANWTVERGDPEAVPAAPSFVATGLTKDHAVDRLREG